MQFVVNKVGSVESWGPQGLSPQTLELDAASGSLQAHVFTEVKSGALAEPRWPDGGKAGAFS